MHIRPIAPLAAALALLAGCAATINKDGLEQRTVNTRDGTVYRCYLYGATGFQRAMSFGQTPHSDAICTAMAGGKSGGTQGPAATGQSGGSAGGDCNAVLRAARRC